MVQISLSYLSFCGSEEMNPFGINYVRMFVCEKREAVIQIRQGKRIGVEGPVQALANSFFKSNKVHRPSLPDSLIFARAEVTQLATISLNFFSKTMMYQTCKIALVVGSRKTGRFEVLVATH